MAAESRGRHEEPFAVSVRVVGPVLALVSLVAELVLSVRRGNGASLLRGSVAVGW